jgi:glycosyltransferase involved in cell wall biosynthesis
MRILQIVPLYHPHIGGVEYVVKSVAERLNRIDHDVTVLAGEPEVERPREEVVGDVRVVRWPTWSPGDAYHVPRLRGELRRVLLELARYVDVIHVHSVHSIISMYALGVVKGLGVRVVVTPYYHGTGHTLFRRLLWIPWRPYVRSLLRNTIIHTVSKLEAKLVERDFGCKAIVIENGVDELVKSFTWIPEDYVMYSGRIERYKNVDLLARIVKKLNEKYELNLKLKITGRGPYRGKLEEFLRGLGVPFETEDFKPYKEYIETLSHATLFGLLSERESYPQSINEANAIGVPAVVARSWGLNFGDRRRTLIIDLRKDLDTLADEIYSFLRKTSEENKSLVPTWSEVVQEYIKKLYSDQI